MRFRNRHEAGLLLADALRRYKDERPLVLGLPRGGVPVAYEVARSLGAPLDIWVVRKVGVPDQPELGMGAVAEGGGFVLDSTTVQALGISNEEVERATRREIEEVARRVGRFRGGRPSPQVGGRTVIVVDDGAATGGTARAAARAIRAQHPRRLVLALPVAAADAIAELRREVDCVVCLQMPSDLGAVGRWYDDFAQTTDDEVAELLHSKAPAPSLD